MNFIGFGAIQGSEPYEFIGFGDIHGPKPYEFMGFGDIHDPKPYKFIRFGDIHGPKPYKIIGFGNPKARSESGKISLLPARIRQKIGIRRCRSRPEERPEALSCSLVVLRFSHFGWSQSPCVGFQRAETFLWICGRL